ncbi:CHAD domain-containing protein [Geofilum sp. OHC36d9]|uniref:CHAD domain-containing protein n=1 Tax=Geofilum sp. OHC36d9 TaxID=3458413 RepID=UPI00403360F1
MTTQYFIDKTNECYSALYSGLLTAAQSSDPEAIHRFRVDVKNFVGLMVFVFELKRDALWPNTMIFQLKPYYKLSGKIRNINVVKDLLSAHFDEVPDGFYNYLEGQLLRRQNEFEALTSDIDLPKAEDVKNEVSLLMAASTFSKELLERHLFDNKVKALSLISDNSPGEEWHAARSFFKRNYLLSKLLLAEVMDDVKLSENRILEQELGFWHDIVVLTKTYDRYLLTNDCSSSPSFRKQLCELKQSREKLIYQSTQEVV